jgi:hypothetical protein
VGHDHAASVTLRAIVGGDLHGVSGSAGRRGDVHAADGAGFHQRSATMLPSPT